MKNRSKASIVVVIALILGVAAWMIWGHKASGSASVEIVHPTLGNISSTVSTTGSVLPKNRLELKPPVDGRIDQILVQEGQTVKAGDIVAWMSSTDRAALLDAARGQGADTLAYWQNVYKPIPLIAPIDGQVIVATTQPGQTVTTTDDVIVLSDRLIVRAQVDETDIGNIKVGQKAVITLDAYPDTNIDATVDHIYYESTTVNNVTIYNVDLTPQKVPPFFRSGMNANIDFIVTEKQNVLLLPIAAVKQGPNGSSFVLLKPSEGNKPQRQEVTVGISDDKNMEIVSGLTPNDEVEIRGKRYSSAGGSSSNPFFPSRKKSSGSH